MNRYPLWKYVVMLLVLAIGLLYTLPNFFGEVPGVQISSGKATVKLDASVFNIVKSTLNKYDVHKDDIVFDSMSQNAAIYVRLKDTDMQLRIKDVLQKSLNTRPKDPTYIVTLNLQSASPHWLSALHALPMYLGLDLRGGVHFLLQVDLDGVLNKRLDSDATDGRALLLHNKLVGDSRVNRVGKTVVVNCNNQDNARRARQILEDNLSELTWQLFPALHGDRVIGTLTPSVQKIVLDSVLKQNIITLRNRINELGVAEPIVQQQGTDRIVVELPGIQDTAKAKDIIGRTATLEARMVDYQNPVLNPEDPIPAGDDLFTQGNSVPMYLKKQVIFTGHRITDALVDFDEYQRPAVKIHLDSSGGRVLRDISRNNINKTMAIVLFEKNRGEILTAATIQSELGENFRITGELTLQAATDLALLLRAGSLAAPMEIVEERTLGPSVGLDNIKKGFNSVQYGFLAIAVFIIAYYMLFGLISVIALSVNLFLLVASLSMMHATLTLPGIAAIALTLGMAIDSNVLINERVREELRYGASAQLAIQNGFLHAWVTILDSSITMLIAGLSLLTFGSGPVRGFAVVYCVGILTSMFSAVFFARGLVNLWYGNKKRLKSLAIGQIWSPEDALVQHTPNLPKRER
ncbi:Protein translocase subunit SecD [Candidatus Vallotia tarda]|uniref:Protein translocase subunit SecD n=1 Tax=Candidatus Vallotiella hemipterorum TaxID=1177213 RepID=A0A916NUS2_9BURK|nr:Protein translocase subunit SecD [Candidatus Vallotia tarda]